MPTASTGELTVAIPRQRIRWVLLLGVVILSIIYLLGLIARHHLGHANLYGTIDRFHFDGEANVPSLYATLLLLGCGVVVACIAAGKQANHDPFSRHWIGLAAILFFMAADEGALFHEMLTRPMRDITDSAGGWLRYAWVVPGAAISAIVGLAYLRFLFHLPRATASRFAVCGAVFVGSAIGMEMIGGWYVTTHDNDFRYFLLAGIEEALEMVSVIYVLDTALAYLATQTSAVRLVLEPGAVATADPGSGSGGRMSGVKHA